MSLLDVTLERVEAAGRGLQPQVSREGLRAMTDVRFDTSAVPFCGPHPGLIRGLVVG